MIFDVTWDYRCPFARNAHEHLLTALASGADWQVRFVPFSLGQMHIDEGQPSVWDKPEQDSGIRALQVGTVVRDDYPSAFPSLHRALFALRHDQAQQLDDRDALSRVLTAHGVPADAVFARLDSGEALRTVQREHEAVAQSHSVWGVPTFLAGDQAVFVRLMDRSTPGSDPSPSKRAIERILDLLTGWTDLNEFKRTTIPR